MSRLDTHSTQIIQIQKRIFPLLQLSWGLLDGFYEMNPFLGMELSFEFQFSKRTVDNNGPQLLDVVAAVRKAKLLIGDS